MSCLLPAPDWLSYTGNAQLACATVRRLPTEPVMVSGSCPSKAGGGDHPSHAGCSCSTAPSNPPGMVMDRAELEGHRRGLCGPSQVAVVAIEI